MLRHKTSLNKFKMTEIMQSIFSNHNTWKPKINCKKKAGKTTNTWRLKYMILNNDWVKEEIRKVKRYVETNKNNSTTSEFGEYSKSGDKREVYSIIRLPQKTRKFSNKQLTLHLKELEKNK